MTRCSTVQILHLTMENWEFWKRGAWKMFNLFDYVRLRKRSIIERWWSSIGKFFGRIRLCSIAEHNQNQSNDWVRLPNFRLTTPGIQCMYCKMYKCTWGDLYLQSCTEQPPMNGPGQIAKGLKKFTQILESQSLIIRVSKICIAGFRAHRVKS